MSFSDSFCDELAKLAKKDRSDTWWNRAWTVHHATSSPEETPALRRALLRGTGKGLLTGAGIGTLAGAAIGGLASRRALNDRPGRPVLRPAAAAAVGGGIGGIYGGVLGASFNQNRTMRSWLKERGIRTKWHGMDWEISPEARRRYGARIKTKALSSQQLRDAAKTHEKRAEAPSSAIKERGPMPGFDLAKLERHANEHRLMALLGIDHRGRPLGGGS